MHDICKCPFFPPQPRSFFEATVDFDDLAVYVGATFMNGGDHRASVLSVRVNINGLTVAAQKT